MTSQLLALNQTQAGVAALVGLVLPTILAVPIQQNWSSQFKALFATGAYGAAAVVTALASGKLTGATWWETSLVIFLTGAIAYQSVWKPTGIAPAIEIATTPLHKIRAATVATTTSTATVTTTTGPAPAVLAARRAAGLAAAGYTPQR